MTLARVPPRRFRPSPNHNARRLPGMPDMLVLHYTGMAGGAAAEDWLCDPRAEVSSHYLVHEDGEIVQMVAEDRRAWHAGAGRWKGEDDINSRSLGIEIVNPGHEHGYRDFPSIQVEAVIALCRDCVGRWPIPPERVLAHSDTAPARKADPGEKFPWDQLFRAGIGHWREPAPMGEGTVLRPGMSGPAIRAFQAMLGGYGYDLAPSGTFDEATRFCTIAFQRHFRPARVDGCADPSTLATLVRLRSALGDEEARAPRDAGLMSL